MLIRITPGKIELAKIGDTEETENVFTPSADSPRWLRIEDIAAIRPQPHLDTICCVDVRTNHSKSTTHYIINESPKRFAGRVLDAGRLAVTPLTATKAKECEAAQDAPSDPPSNEPPK